MTVRKTSSFEKMLLIVGMLILVLGCFLISKVYVIEGSQLSWGFLQTIFLWLLMVIFIIVLAIGEDIKKDILIQQLEEIKGPKESMNSKKKVKFIKGYFLLLQVGSVLS